MVKHHYVRGLLAGVLALLCACSGSGTGDARIGQSVDTAFFTVQVTEVLEGSDAPAAPELPAPPQDSGYIWVKIAVKASMDMSLYYDDFDLEIDGELRFPERSRSALQLPEDQRLAAGETAEGYLVFLVPHNGKALRLVYQEYYGGDRQGAMYTVRLDS